MAWFRNPTLIDKQPSVEVLRKRHRLKMQVADSLLCGGKGGKPGPCPGPKKTAEVKAPKEKKEKVAKRVKAAKKDLKEPKKEMEKAKSDPEQIKTDVKDASDAAAKDANSKTPDSNADDSKKQASIAETVGLFNSFAEIAHTASIYNHVKKEFPDLTPKEYLGHLQTLAKDGVIELKELNEVKTLREQDKPITVRREDSAGGSWYPYMTPGRNFDAGIAARRG